MNEQQIIKLIQDTLASLTSNATSPHRHNGVDALQIPIQNILVVPNIGYPLKSNLPADPEGIVKQYNLYVNSNFSDSAPLILEPNSAFIDEVVGSPTEGENTSQLFIGKGGVLNGNVFGQVFTFTNSLEADAEIYSEATAFDTGESSAVDIRPLSVSVTTNIINLLASAAGTFAVQLPDVARPSPVAGMIAFQGGTFYACEVTGTWKTIVTL